MNANLKREIISWKRDTGYRIVAATQPLWYEWGNAEAMVLGPKLQAIPIEKPVYITGLARAGTTILLELIASHPAAASHCYKDFPFLPNIYSWRRYLQAFQKHEAVPQERSHRDGLHVTADSPEAFEEMLWMRFFPKTHDETASAVLDEKTRNAAFETFYRNHIRSLLLASGRSRYVAKGNYNISRMRYLRKLFADARFIVAVRHPVSHIGSLMKQHTLLCGLQTHNPALLRYMRQAGHFEFGLDRRIINLGGDTGAIRNAWQDGREVEGWALYWNDVYRYLIRQLQDDPALAAATRIVTYESLCGEPEKNIRELCSHSALDGGALVAQWKDKLKYPTYYKPEFSPTDRETIQRITGQTAAHFGYDLR